MLCMLYDSSAGYSRHKLSHSRTHRPGAKPRNGAESATNIGQARSINPTGAKPLAGAAPAKLLAARNFDPLASGSDAGELAAQPPAGSGTNFWLKPILFALGGGGILSLFVAKAAEL